jgi:hypothetical protein
MNYNTGFSARLFLSHLISSRLDSSRVALPRLVSCRLASCLIVPSRSSVNWNKTKQLNITLLLPSNLPASTLIKVGSTNDLYSCSYGAGTEGDPCTATMSDLLCVPFWVPAIPDSSTRALWQLSAETSISEAEETWLQMAVEFCLLNAPFALVWFFNVP